MKFKTLLFLLVSLLTVTAFAQTGGGIKGTVISRTTRAKIDNVKITLVPGDRTASTDDSGEFLFENVAPGEYELRFETAEFEDLTLPVRVGKNMREMRVIMVPANRQPVLDDAIFAEFDTETMDDAQSLPTSLSASKDVFNNIASYQFSEMRFNVRGYDSQFSDVYMNGIQLNDAMTGYTPWSLWSGLNDATRNQEVTTGLEMGEMGIGGIAGVTNINTRPSQMRKGLRASLVSTNSMYRFRGLQDAPHEVVHGGGLIDPGADNALVALAGSVAGDLAQQLGAVEGLLTGSLGCGGVDGAVPVAGVHDGGILLDDTEIQAVLGGKSSGTHAAVACAHDDDIGIPCLGDGSLVDVGLGAQPVVLVAGGQLYAGDNSLALCLCIAILGSFHDSLGGDGGTGNAVDLGRTGSHQLLAQLIGSGSTVGCGLTRGVNYNVGDSTLREGHGDLDGGGDTLGSALIGAGDVGAGCTGSGSAAGSSGGGGAGGGIAGGQSAGGHTAHGGGSGDLQKAFAGDLVHAFLSFLCFFFFVCDTYSIYILLKH